MNYFSREGKSDKVCCRHMQKFGLVLKATWERFFEISLHSTHRIGTTLVHYNVIDLEEIDVTFSVVFLF